MPPTTRFAVAPVRGLDPEDHDLRLQYDVAVPSRTTCSTPRRRLWELSSTIYQTCRPTSCLGVTIDTLTIIALVGAAISLFTAGITTWQARTARRQARAAESQNRLLRQQMLDDQAAHLQMIRAQDTTPIERLAVVAAQTKGQFTFFALDLLREAVQEAYLTVIGPDTRARLRSVLVQIVPLCELRLNY